MPTATLTPMATAAASPAGCLALGAFDRLGQRLELLRPADDALYGKPLRDVPGRLDLMYNQIRKAIRHSGQG